MLPVIVPPDLGSAALAVLVVVVSTPSLVAISTPSTVPDTAILPVTSILLEISNVSVAVSHNIEAFVDELTASCIIIPAPSAVAVVSPDPKFNVIVLSSTSSVAAEVVVTIP